MYDFSKPPFVSQGGTCHRLIPPGDKPLPKNVSGILTYVLEHAPLDPEKLFGTIEQGDEIWVYCSDPASWRALCGRLGFLLVRDGQVIARHLALLS